MAKFCRHNHDEFNEILSLKTLLVKFPLKFYSCVKNFLKFVNILKFLKIPKISKVSKISKIS